MYMYTYSHMYVCVYTYICTHTYTNYITSTCKDWFRASDVREVGLDVYGAGPV